MDPTNTKEPRGPVSLRIKFRSASLDQFIERYAVDVSRGGIFIRTREPLAVGTQLKFDFQLQDAAPLLAGEGTVVWIREHDPARAGVTPGMGVRFDKLTTTSQPVLEKILNEKASRQQAGTMPGALVKGAGGMAARRASSTFSALDPSAGRGGGVAAQPAGSADSGSSGAAGSGPAGRPPPLAPTAPAGTPGPLAFPATPASPPAPPARSNAPTGPFAVPPGPARSVPPLAPVGLRPPAMGAPTARPRVATPAPPAGQPRPAMARAPMARPATPATPFAVTPPPRTAPAGASPAEAPAIRPRANTGMGLVRPAPAPPMLFEPPTADDIDKALEALREMPSEAPPAPPLPSAASAAPGAAVADYPSNEPTRISDTPLGAFDRRTEALSQPPQRRSGPQPIFSSEPPPRRAPTPPTAIETIEAVEDEDSEKTQLSVDPSAVLAELALAEVTMPPPAAEPVSEAGPVTPPPAYVPPYERGRQSLGIPALPLPTETAAPARLPARGPSRAPAVLGGLVAAAAVAAIGVYAFNHFKGGQPGQPGQNGQNGQPGSTAGESVATAPAAPAAEPAPAPAATGEKAPAPAAPVQAQREGATGHGSAPAAAAPGPAPEKPAASPEAAAAPKTAAAERGGTGMPRKAGGPRRRVTSKADEVDEAVVSGLIAADKAAAADNPAGKAEGAAKPEAGDKPEAAARDERREEGGGAPPQHFLKITSTPAGADVVVDGAAVGKTPFLGKEIDPTAPHAITLKKDGYESHEHMISSSDWSRPRNGVQTLKLNVKLRPTGGAAEKSGEVKVEEIRPEPLKPKDEAPASP